MLTDRKTDILFFVKNRLNKELAVCGFAAVRTLAEKHESNIRRFYFTPDRAAFFGDLCRKLSKRHAVYNMVEDPLELEKLCGSIHHQGVVAMITQPQIQPLNTDITTRWLHEKEDALILDRVGNANNLGAIVRSAAFFGIRNIVIPLDEAQASITTSSYRVAQGGMEFVTIYSIKSISRLLQDMSGRMERIGTSLDARKPVSEIKRLRNGKPLLIVLGNEETGISPIVKRECDNLVIIPFVGMEMGTAAPVESLNVAQAAAVILYECGRSRIIK